MQEHDYYVIDPESATEMARLLEQDVLISGDQALPELSPEALSRTNDVLDVASGSGGWALELARQQPHIQNIVGIDISKLMVSYSTQLAKAEHFSHVHFYEMDVKNLSSFPDESFDIINMRFITGFMLRRAWLPLIKECKRLLRPGGVLRLTESESTLTNSEVQNHLGELMAKGMYISGRGFNPTGTFGVVNMLPSFLRQAGFRDITIHSNVIDISYGQEKAAAVHQNFVIALGELEKFFMQLQLVESKAVFLDLIEQLKKALQSEDYTGLWVLITSMGIK